MHKRSESDPEPTHEARFRLFGSGSRGVRPSIVLGPAVLERAACGGGRWTLAVRDDGTLEPTTLLRADRMSRVLSRRSPRRRVVVAIASPVDFHRRRIPMPGRLLGRNGAARPTAFHTIYGWALAYRFPESTGVALVDPHDDVPDLPAFYESAAELVDRIVHLEARGFETRPVALLVHDHDFVHDDHGGRINRYFPTPPRPPQPD